MTESEIKFVKYNVTPACRTLAGARTHVSLLSLLERWKLAFVFETDMYHLHRMLWLAAKKKPVLQQYLHGGN